MTDAPEKIWMLVFDDGSWERLPFESTADNVVAYTRTDLIPALEAAAYARGLEDAAKVAEGWDGFQIGAAAWPYHIAAAIRALGDK